MLLVCILIILISNATTFRRDKSIIFSRLSLLTLISSCLILVTLFNFTFLTKSISLFGGLFYCNSRTFVFSFIIFLLSISILCLTSFYPRKSVVSSLNLAYNKILNKMGEQFLIIEYPLIILFIIMGSIFLISSSDLISIFLSLELQSYGLYLIATIYRNSELATNAGLTYFLLGSLASCFILLGIGILYINSGSTSLDNIFIINSILSNNDGVMVNSNSFDYIQLSFAIISIGLLVKLSASPFHFWGPDVYDSLPTIVTTFVSIIAKISLLLLLFEFVNNTNNTMFNYSWKSTLLISSSLSLIIGSLLGLTQSRVKRLFAYSTVSHLGFILLALSINSSDSIGSFIFYLTQYSFTNLNAFIILIAIGFSFLGLKGTVDYNLVDSNLSPIQLTQQLKGFYYINPFLALSLSITLFSLVGVPPLIGFFAKQSILSAALDQGYIFISLLAIVTSVISAVYYLNLIKIIFFEQPDNALDTTDVYSLSGSLTLNISILTWLILLFIFFPSEIFNLTTLLTLFN